MTFNELADSIKKQFDDHPEIILERDILLVKITDIFGNNFYISWKNRKCNIIRNCTRVCDISIIASQRDIELLFSQKQYLFVANHSMNISGSFTDVMDFHKLISYITGDDKYIINAEIISRLLIGQDMLKEDLGLIMKSLHLLITGSLANSLDKDVFEKYATFQSTETHSNIQSEASSKRNKKAKNNTSSPYKIYKKSTSEALKSKEKRPAAEKAKSKK